MEFKSNQIIKMMNAPKKVDCGVFEIENVWDKSFSCYKLKKDGTRAKNGLNIFRFDHAKKYGQVINVYGVAGAITEVNKSLKDIIKGEKVISYIPTDKKAIEDKDIIRVIKPIQLVSSIYAIPTGYVYSCSVSQKENTNIVLYRLGKKGQKLNGLGEKNMLGFSHKNMNYLIENGFIEVVEQIEMTRKETEKANNTPQENELGQTEKVKEERVKMNMIIHPTKKKIVREEDFEMFRDWKSVQFINATNCEIVETENGFKLIGFVNGEKFESDLSKEDYFDGKNFIYNGDEIKRKEANGKIVLTNEEARKLDMRFVYDQATPEEEQLLKDYHLQLQEEAMSYFNTLPSNYEELIQDVKIYKVVSAFGEDHSSAGIYEVEMNGEELKKELWVQARILNVITPLEEVSTVEENESQEGTQENEIHNNSTEGESLASYSINEEKNGIEISFNDKPSEEIRSQLKTYGFRWSKYQKIWYAKQSEDRIKFVKNLCGNAENSDNSMRKIELQKFEYPEIDINDIESYIVDKDLQKREHDSSFVFRITEKDRTKEIQDIFLSYNNQVMELLETTENERIAYYLKRSLQSFKKKYYDVYVKMLQHRANNPSWAVTGRSGLNVSRYNKMSDRYDKLMGESVELSNNMDKAIKRAKNDIRKDKDQRANEIIKQKLENTNVNIEFKTMTKEFSYMGYSEKKRVYSYENYFICKLWACFRIFKDGLEVHSMKTTQNLEDAKKYATMLILDDLEQKQLVNA